MQNLIPADCKWHQPYEWNDRLLIMYGLVPKFVMLRPTKPVYKSLLDYILLLLQIRRTKTQDPSNGFVLCSFKSPSSCVMASWLFYRFLVRVAEYFVNDVYLASCSQHLTSLLLANNFLLFCCLVCSTCLDYSWESSKYFYSRSNNFFFLHFVILHWSSQKYFPNFNPNITLVGVTSATLSHWHPSPLSRPSFLLGFRHPCSDHNWWDCNRSPWAKSVLCSQHRHWNAN